MKTSPLLRSLVLSLTLLTSVPSFAAVKKDPYNAPTYQPLGRWDGIFHYIPQVFRHEKSSIYYKYIEPLNYCFFQYRSKS